jgi:hypothetical protein
MYQEGRLSLEDLREVSPLVARTVEDDLAKGKDWRLARPEGREGRRRGGEP